MNNRAGQRLSNQPNEGNNRRSDPYSEIDRRNQRVLHPLNAKDSYGTSTHHTSFIYHKNKLSSSSFNLETYHSYCHRRRDSSQRTEEYFFKNSTNHSKKLQEKRTQLSTITSSNADFLYGNSIIKSNKEDVLNILEQQSTLGGTSNTYTNRHGVIIGEDGPFWPREFRILHPTPKLLTRELTPKEFYFTVTNTALSSKLQKKKNTITIK